MRPETRVSLTVSTAWGLLVSIAAYAILRAVQALLFPAPDPARLVWSAHAGFFWRAWTVTYAGGMATFVTLALVRGQTERAARALAPAVVVAATLIALQSVFFP